MERQEFIEALEGRYIENNMTLVLQLLEILALHADVFKKQSSIDLTKNHPASFFS